MHPGGGAVSEHCVLMYRNGTCSSVRVGKYTGAGIFTQTLMHYVYVLASKLVVLKLSRFNNGTLILIGKHDRETGVHGEAAKV